MSLGYLNTLSAVVAELEARIVEIDASDFAAITATAAFHAASSLSVQAVGSGLRHLAFEVQVVRCTVESQAFDSVRAVELAPDIAVRFLYQIRAGAQQTDKHKSMDAAVAVAGALLSDPIFDVNVNPIDLYTPTGTDDGQWLLVEQFYRVRFDQSLSRGRAA